MQGLPPEIQNIHNKLINDAKLLGESQMGGMGQQQYPPNEWKNPNHR